MFAHSPSSWQAPRRYYRKEFIAARVSPNSNGQWGLLSKQVISLAIIRTKSLGMKGQL